MSGESYSTDCPRCGAKDALQGYRDWKPYDQVSALCLVCGFRVSTVTEIATLDEVNEEREEKYLGGQELTPLKELAKPLEEWLKWGYEPKKEA